MQKGNGAGASLAASQSSDEDPLPQALLEALEKEQASSASTSDSSNSGGTTNATQMLTAALKAYMQSSTNGFATQADTLLGSNLFT